MAHVPATPSPLRTRKSKCHAVTALKVAKCNKRRASASAQASKESNDCKPGRNKNTHNLDKVTHGLTPLVADRGWQMPSCTPPQLMQRSCVCVQKSVCMCMCVCACA